MLKKFFKLLFQKKVFILFIIVSTFALGVFIGQSYNHVNQEYVVAFQSESKPENLDSIISLDALNYIKNRDISKKETNPNYNVRFDKIDTEKLVNTNSISIKLENEAYIITAKSRYFNDFFLSSTKSVSTRAKMFIKELILEFDNNALFLYENIYITQNSLNIYLVGGITCATSLLIYLTYLVAYLKKEKQKKLDAKNQLSILSKKYWESSLSAFSKTKNLVTIAMLFALMMVCKMFSIPTGFANLTVSFTYIFFALISMIYGPFAGFIIGAFSDIIGFFLFPNGPTFFFGYTIQAALSGLIYGLCLYKKSYNFMNVFFARFLINIFMNVIWGSICFGILYSYDISTTLAYMITYALPKNLIYLLPQTFILYLVIKAMQPVLKRLNYLK